MRSSPGSFPAGFEEGESQVKKSTLLRLGFVPIPALILTIALLYLTVRPSLFYDPPWLIPITNTLFVAAVCFTVAFIAMRNYLATGRMQILLMGCGVLIFGIGGFLAGLLRGFPDGANLNVTIYNIGALVGALFHFIAALLLSAGIAPEVGPRQKGAWLAIGYSGVIFFMAILTAASLRGALPPFFVQGAGPTPLRQAILGSADILFVFSFAVFLVTYMRNREEFLYWYSLALALTSVSLTAFFIQHSIGSPVGWAGRVSQYLGGVYFFIALMTASRSAGARRTSFDNIITNSLTPAEERFRALAENSPDIIDRFDREMRHIYVNPAGLKMHQKPAASIIGRSIDETGDSGSFSSLWKERLSRVFGSGESLLVEEFLPAPGGERFYQSRCVPEYGVDGNVANVLVISRDLTERKRTEERILHQNRVLEGINRIFREALTCRTEEQLGQACLKVAEEVTESKIGFIGEIGLDGLLLDLAISDPGWELCTMYDKSGHRRTPDGFKLHGVYGRVLLDGKGFFTNDPKSHPDSIGLPEGHPPLTSFLGVPFIQEGVTYGMVGLANRQGGYGPEELETLEALVPAIEQAFRSKRAEDALRRAHDELELKVGERTRELRARDEMLLMQSRQAAMGEMLRNIAHQWRQPLNSVGLILQSLTLLYDAGELDRKSLVAMEGQVMELIRHMSRTIDDFRDYFRPDKEKAPFHVGRAVEKTVSLVEAGFRNSYIATEVVMKDEPVIVGYQNEYSQVLLNILHNARDAFENGEISDPRVSIAIGRENGRSVVRISDNAGGIPEEIMHKIFDPYFTTKGPDKGTGVGLFMAKAIIEKNMGGRLTVRNTGRGAEFTIEV